MTSSLPPSPLFLLLPPAQVVAELSPEFEERGRKALTPFPTCLAWAADGATLYVGYNDNIVRVYVVSA